MNNVNVVTHIEMCGVTFIGTFFEGDGGGRREHGPRHLEHGLEVICEACNNLAACIRYMAILAQASLCSLLALGCVLVQSTGSAIAVQSTGSAV